MAVALAAGNAGNAGGAKLPGCEAISPLTANLCSRVVASHSDANKERARTDQESFEETTTYNALMGAMLVILELGSIPDFVGGVTEGEAYFDVVGFTEFANELAPDFGAERVSPRLAELFLGAGHLAMVHMNFESAGLGRFRSPSLKLARLRWNKEVGRRMPWLVRPDGDWIAGDDLPLEDLEMIKTLGMR